MGRATGFSEKLFEWKTEEVLMRSWSGQCWEEKVGIDGEKGRELGRAWV